jgi:alpha-L-fucosidase 2
MKITFTICILTFGIFFALSVVHAQKRGLGEYNIKWTSPGNNSLGSMPLGNGDIGVNVWVEQNGDLLFYLSKTDAWSENCQLLNLGKMI